MKHKIIENPELLVEVEDTADGLVLNSIYVNGNNMGQYSKGQAKFDVRDMLNTLKKNTVGEISSAWRASDARFTDKVVGAYTIGVNSINLATPEIKKGVLETCLTLDYVRQPEIPTGAHFLKTFSGFKDENKESTDIDNFLNAIEVYGVIDVTMKEQLGDLGW